MTIPIETAPVVHDDPECDVETCDGLYVLHDFDRVCRQCGHISGTGGDTKMNYRDRHLPERWRQYEQERENYDGFRGENRIKFPGGFVSAYDFGPDFDL